jgi:hypothetical protein
MTKRFLFALGLLAVLGGCSKFSSTPPESDWKNYGSDKFLFSLDSPYPLEFKEQSFVAKTGMRVRVVQSAVRISEPKPHQVILDVITHQFTKELKVRYIDFQVEARDLPDGGYWKLEEILDGLEANLREGFKEKGGKFEFKRTETTCGKVPATQVEGTFVINANILAKPHFRSSMILATQGNRLWKVSFLCGDIQEYVAIKDRVFKSLKVGDAAP